MSVEDYVAVLDKALSDFDMDWLREQMPGATDLVVEIAAHKARYEHTSLPITVREESRAWLEQRGYGRLYGQPWDVPWQRGSPRAVAGRAHMRNP